MGVADGQRSWRRRAATVLALVGLYSATACSSNASKLHARAADEGKNLLALVPSVEGAKPASKAPTKSLREAPTRPSLTGLVTQARYWTVARDASSVYAELTREVPDGLTNDGRGNVTGPSLQDDLQYATDHPKSLPAGVSYAQLLLAVAPMGPDTSAIGAYSQVVAQPARPATEIVPSSASATATASYGEKVTRSEVLSAMDASRLVRDFNLLTISTIGETSCPMGDGSAIGAIMRADGHTWRSTGSCGNGFESVTRDGENLPALNSSSAFIRDLNRALDVPPSAPIVNHLARIARGLAQENGKAFSAQAVWVPHHSTASRYLAEAIDHDTRPVWAIEMQGRFTCRRCSIPPGAKIPRGTVLIEIVDARTFRSEDFSLSRRFLPLSELGPTFRLPI